MSKLLECKVLSESPTSGLKRVELSDEATEAVMYWFQDHGVEWRGVVRKGRLTSKGRLRFSCGVGYAVFSADLLGGTADGEAERRFQMDTGCVLRLV